MRVALAQINTTVGDIDGNVCTILEAIGRAQALGAGYTVFPELAITGYPPEDLLHKEHFVEANLDALERISSACLQPVLVGYVDRVGDRLYNALAMCGNGCVLQRYHKRRLPNYGVFDEERYFAPGQGPGLTELGGTMMANTICEDIWVPELVAEAAEQGAQVVFNSSASPFHAGKGAEREQMLAKRARANNVWLVYCNLVGGQDELVFDGRSLIISPHGEVIARGRAFEEDLVVADFAPEGRLGASGDIEPEVTGAHEVYSAITLGLHDYVVKNGFTDVVLGLSGGIDSALTAAIAADALGAQHVHGVMMPSRYSSPGSISDSQALATSLGIDLRILPIEPAYQALLDTLEPTFSGLAPDVAEENLQARVRGTLLMALSNKFGWLTLATGNKSELSVGYSTLYGDMVGGFAPLKDVFKTRVYELARWRNEHVELPVIPQAILDKAPSAELKPDQLDQDSLPPYVDLDGVLTAYVEGDQSRAEIVAAGFDPATVDRVIRLTDTAEYKRRQGPLGVRITSKAFGRDRRMPVTNAFGGLNRSVAGFSIELVTHDWHRFDDVLDLSYEVLYRDFGVARQGEWYHPAHGSEFAVALARTGPLLGTARLLPSSHAASRQVRQVAVVPDARGRGVGNALMAELEKVAAREGASELWLHSRENAFGFYERLGYVPEGTIFVSELTGIPHRTMRKRLR